MGDRPHGLSQGPACVLHMPGLVCAVENPCKQRRDGLTDAPTAARKVGLPGTPAHLLGPEGFQRASGKPFGAPAGAGLTRRLRRGSRACSPMGRSHFSFDGERKVCKRKPAARRLREKGSYCPFCRRGSQCRAQWSWIAYTQGRSALVLAFFRRQNGRAFFPPLPIAALLPRSWRGA